MQEQSFAGATEPAQRLRAPSPCQRDPWVSLPKPFTALEFWPLRWAAWLFLVTRRNATLVSLLQRMISKPEQHHVSGGQTQRQTLRQTDNLCAPGVLVLIRVKYFSKDVSSNLHEITAICLFTNQVSQCMSVSTYCPHSNGSWEKVENTNNHDLSQKNCSRVYHPLEELNCT